MIDERRLVKMLLSLSLQSPQAADCSRRQLLCSLGRFGLGTAATTALAKILAVQEVLAADPSALPEITSIPERLKGSGAVRVCSYGGAFQDAQRKAYFEPFERLSGIKVIESQGPDPVKIKAMVDTKNIEYDIH
jgi:putative spermidine/putrescine transport system substrate-binding protein